jgi:hypothetical protein
MQARAVKRPRTNRLAIIPTVPATSPSKSSSGVLLAVFVLLALIVAVWLIGSEVRNHLARHAHAYRYRYDDDEPFVQA